MTILNQIPAGDAAIRIQNRTLAVNCLGRSGPVVVFETGLGAESAEWGPVQKEIALEARTFRYDRAGRGASGPAPTPRTGIDMVDELHAALGAMRLAPPYILVGQSLGGTLMRIFAGRYHGEVAGLVLVDSMHVDQFETIGSLFPQGQPLEPPFFKNMREFWQGGWRHPQSNTEGIDLEVCMRQARDVASLGDLPLHVMIAGASFLTLPGLPLAAREMLQGTWERLQGELGHLSSNSKVSVHPNSGHFIQRDQPNAITEVVRQMLRHTQSAAE